MLYELLTGRPPFKAATPLETVLQVLHEEPVPPGRLQPKLPRDLETICLTCLRKEPQRRYASALALAEDLRRFLAGEPIWARPVGLLERGFKWARRRPAGTALIAVSSAAFVVLLAGVFWHQVNMSAALLQVKTEREQVRAERQRADANYREAVDLVLEFARKLADLEKYPEAIAMMNRAIAKQETLLHGEQNPERQEVLAAPLQVAYGLRAAMYATMMQFREARADLERLPEGDWSPMADIYRSLLAMVLAKLGAYKEASTKAESLAQKTGLSGESLYYLALAFSASVPAVRQDTKLSATDRDRLANDYADRALALLYRARAAGFFADPAMGARNPDGVLGLEPPASVRRFQETAR